LNIGSRFLVTSKFVASNIAEIGFVDHQPIYFDQSPGQFGIGNHTKIMIYNPA